MESKGLTISILFEASSLNYGEGLGNVTSLKKLTRGDGESYTYISRQALRYNIINQLGWDVTKLAVESSVIQFAPDAKITDYPEIDLFGYMKTKKSSSKKSEKADKGNEEESSNDKTMTRAAVVRLSNGVSVESFAGDLDFLTNKGLYDRSLKDITDTKNTKDGGNIAQSEIHMSYYTYTIAVDLEKVGIDKQPTHKIDDYISQEEKTKRINALLDTVKFLYRDIKGRREDLKPLFIIGGIYDRKNPFFENKIKVKNNEIQIETLLSILELDEEIKQNTACGLIKGIFKNEAEIIEKLGAVELKPFFVDLKEKVHSYYEG
jgi:CRISPR-associated protein Cst2